MDEDLAQAVATWKAGQKVRKAIGYDASPADQRRRCSSDKITFKVNSADARKYDFWYPLQEWGWDRLRCIREISGAGLPLPMKSSCWFCPNMKENEIDILPKDLLQRIVVMEARASVRLEGWMTQEQLDASYAKKLAKWKLAPDKKKAPRRKVAGEKGLMRGLWRAKLMTDYIRAKGLLAAEEIDRLWAVVPKEIVLRNEAKAAGNEVETWSEFFGKVGVKV